MNAVDATIKIRLKRCQRAQHEKIQLPRSAQCSAVEVFIRFSGFMSAYIIYTVHLFCLQDGRDRTCYLIVECEINLAEAVKIEVLPRNK